MDFYENDMKCFLKITTKNDRFSLHSEGDTPKIKCAEKKKKKKLVTVHQVFLDIMEGTDDKDWKDFCINASYGVFPFRGFVINDNIISFKSKKKSFSFDLNEEYSTPEERFLSFKTFVNNTGFFTANDNINELIKREIKDMKWSDVRISEQKIALINDFCNRKAEKYNLSSVETEILKNMIQSSIYTGLISSKDVIMDMNSIKKIKGFKIIPKEKNKIIILDELKILILKQFFIIFFVN